MIDFAFVNGSAPYLNAENLNSIVGSINDNESSISVLEDIVDDLTHEIVPESIVKEAVDDYVEEHSGGFATETELQSLNESLTSKQDKTDNSLNTTSKTVVGAINEINNILPSKLSFNNNTWFQGDFGNILFSEIPVFYGQFNGINCSSCPTDNDGSVIKLGSIMLLYDGWEGTWYAGTAQWGQTNIVWTKIS